MKKLKTWPVAHALIQGNIKLKLQIMRPIPSILAFIECYRAGVPSPWSMDWYCSVDWYWSMGWYWSVTCWELGFTAGGERQVNE